MLFAVISLNLNAQNNSNLKNNQQENTTYVIENVNIIPMTKENKVIENATVVIKENKIFTINGSIPENATTIDGTDKWLIPGLIDMHVHTLADGSPFVIYPTKGPLVSYNTQYNMTPYIANGVTTVFDLGAEQNISGNEMKL